MKSMIKEISEKFQNKNRRILFLLYILSFVIVIIIHLLCKNVKFSVLWNTISIAFTFGYTLFIHIPTKEVNLDKNSFIWMRVGDILLGIITVGVVLDIFNVYNLNIVPIYIGGIAVIGCIYTYLDYLIYHSLERNSNSNPEEIQKWKNFMYLSDLPATIAFFVLFFSSLLLYIFENQLNDYDTLFAGTNAFMLMYSNIIWILNDK